MDCKHENFVAECNVHRLTDDEGNVTDYLLEVKVHCSDCFMPFTFEGVVKGVNLNKPCLNLAGTTLSIPIKPCV